MEIPSNAYWNCEPGNKTFGSKFGQIAGLILRHSDNLGFFIKSDWNDFILNKYLVDIDIKNFREFVTPTNYQDWLKFYFRVSKNVHKIENPLECSINHLRGVYNKRPPWALNFASKGFKQLPENMLSFSNSNPTMKFWYIEREKFNDSHGRPVITERLSDVGGLLQRLTVVGTLAKSPEISFIRYEDRLTTTKFEPGIRTWFKSGQIEMDELFHSSATILNIT